MAMGVRGASEVTTWITGGHTTQIGKTFSFTKVPLSAASVI